MTDRELLEAIYSDTQEVKQRVSNIENRVTDLEIHMSNMEKRMSSLENRVLNLENRMTEMENRMTEVENRVTQLEICMSEIQDRLSNVEKDVSQLKVIIETEIRTNIQRVAEGHLDLSRNMHEAMKPSNEIEMLAIKVSMLETDVNALKQKIS